MIGVDIMKKLLNITVIISILISFLAPLRVEALETIQVAKVTATLGLFLRSAPDTNSDAIRLLGFGETALVKGVDATISETCDSGWHYVEHNNTLGYVCSKYIEISEVPVAEVDTNFPETYQPGLAILKALHPNWSFVAYQTGLDWSDLIQGQNSLGKSLIQTTNDGWKHLDSYNYLTNTFMNNFVGGGPSWYAASDEIIGYYLDPRNFLNESRIFMFETLSFDPVYHTIEGVQSMLEGTFMSGKPTITQEDITRDISFAQIFMTAASTHNINPYFLVSRVIQEVSRNRSTIVSGTVAGYEGYFNFYNIGATGLSGTIIANGLTRAKNEGWNSEYDAIIGGARFITSNYIAGGQDTLYTQKFDVVGPQFYHPQYMQNIQAPASEANITYKGYLDNDLLEQPFIFKIPVYLNMPVKTETPPIGNPNNYLKELFVDDKLLVGFNPEVTEYTMTVSKLKSSIKVSSNVIVTGTAVSGNGEIPLTTDTTVHEIVVTAQNGAIRKYKIAVIKSLNEFITINEVLEAAKLTFNDTEIKQLPLGLNVDTLKSNISKNVLDLEVDITDINGIIKTNKLLGTGDKVVLTLGDEVKTFSTIVTGDLNGDGSVTIIDLLRVQKTILRTSNLTEVFTKAGDINQDGKIDIIDLLRVQKHILGISTIE
jgi:beta-N-acetylglucosaminidase